MSAGHPAHGEAHQRLLLDATSFEKLLIAAWVIQTQRDLELSPSEYEGLEHSFSARGNVSAKNASSVANSPVARARMGSLPERRATAAGQLVKLPPSRAELVPPQPDVLGSLALAPEPTPWREREPIPFPVLDPARKAGPREISSLEPHLRKLRFLVKDGVRVRLIESKVSLSAANLVAAILVALGIFAFVVWALTARRSQPRFVNAPERASTTSSALVARAGTGSKNSPALELSHLRVTDDTTSTELNELSRYELPSMRRQAEFGDDNAALILGLAYETGYGFPQSCTRAARWILQAALDGNSAAQYNLALRYLEGDGIPVDRGKAKIWLQEAARRGYEPAGSVLHQSGL